MNRRMTYSAMWQNEKFNRMPLGARMLQIGIINYADDQGRAKANPSFLRMQIFPDDEDITNADVQKWLGLIQKNGTIILYTVDEKQYVQLINWWKYQSLQYASPSQFPRPDGWKDRIRKTITKGFIATYNWLTVDGTQLADTCDADGNSLPKSPAPKSSPPSPSPKEDTAKHLNDRASSHIHSGESSGESSGERTILTKLNLTEMNIKERDHAREASSHSGPIQPPPSFSSPPVSPANQPSRYLSREQNQIAEYIGSAKSFGVSAEVFRLMVDAFLDCLGTRSRANAQASGEVLREAQSAINELIHYGSGKFRTVEAVKSILTSWKANDYRGDTPPTHEQFLSHAGLMDMGKVVCTRKNPSAATPGVILPPANKPEPSYKRLKALN